MRSSEKQLALGWLWIFSSVVPLFTILLSFYLQDWYWGLMDDAGIIASGTNVFDRFNNYFYGLIAWGVFRPTFVLHSAIFYSWFEHVPVLMHVLKWAEAVLMLVIWGIAVNRICGHRFALPIFMAAALSFHYLYDTFFFISTHEVIGLLFLGLALNIFLTAVAQADPYWFSGLLSAGVLFLLIGFGAKEPLTSCGIAFGISFGLLGFIDPLNRKRAFGIGGLIFVVSVVYIALLQVYIRGAYTGGYSFSNFSKLWGNFIAWSLKDFANHTPWVILVVVLGLALSRTGSRSNLVSAFTIRQKWGIFTGLLLYGGYLMILLPWSTTSYYAGPLGVFFAFPVSIFVAQVLPQTSTFMQVLVPIGSLILNMFVSQWALTRESLYHYDTQNLMAWVRGNSAFQSAAREKLVYCNGMEAAGTIPGHLARDFSLQLPSFMHGGIQSDPTYSKAVYVWSPRFGGAESDFPRGTWDTMFYSKFWQVYVRK